MRQTLKMPQWKKSTKTKQNKSSLDFIGKLSVSTTHKISIKKQSHFYILATNSFHLQ